MGAISGPPCCEQVDTLPVGAWCTMESFRVDCDAASYFRLIVALSKTRSETSMFWPARVGVRATEYFQSTTELSPPAVPYWALAPRYEPI